MIPMTTAPAALPQVSGRHRNKALAAARRTRAVELVAQGMNYQQVADELGYANRGTVHRIVHRALASDTAEAVHSLKQIESARLDAMQAALWDKAMQGDIEAAQVVLRIITARARLQGLFDLARAAPYTPRTFLGCLQVTWPPG